MQWVRRRDLVLLVLTVNLAVAYFAAGKYVSQYVGTMNSARLIGALMTARMPETAPQPGSSLQPLFGGIGRQAPAPRPSPEQEAKGAQMKAQTATVEAVAWTWRWMTWVLAGWLQVAALVGAITGRLRKWQLLAAAAILLSTAGTGVGLWLLVNPAWGGMPPLSRWTYVLVPAIQGLYAFVLIAAYARRLPGPSQTMHGALEVRRSFEDERADSARF